jgi:hypothetical protein
MHPLGRRSSCPTLRSVLTPVSGTGLAAPLVLFLACLFWPPSAMAQYAESLIQPVGPQEPVPEYPATEGFSLPGVLPPASSYPTLMGGTMAPYIPGYRTSSDGRVTMGYSPSGLNVTFGLFRPEAHAASLASGGPENPSNPASGFLAPTYALNLVGAPGDSVVDLGLGTGEAFRHHGLCDGSTLEPGAQANPQVCGPSSDPRDCYDLTVIASIQVPASSGFDTELYQLPVTVMVADPKTPDAQIVDVQVHAPAGPGGVISPVLLIPGTGSFFEPVFDRSGMLFVGRLGLAPGVAGANESVDVVYAVAPEGGPACDITAWSRWDASDPNGLRPISRAHSDPHMWVGGSLSGSPRFGIAAYPLRDTEGNTLTPGDDAMATYPWMDRDGDNLLLTTVHSTLHYMADDHFSTCNPSVQSDCIHPVYTRYPTRAAPFFVPSFGSLYEVDYLDQTDPLQPLIVNYLPPNSRDSTYRLLWNLEEDSEKRGVTVAGLWTRGKMVIVDGPLNGSDYGLRPEDPLHREIELYQSGTDAAGAADGFVRVGAGSATGWYIGLGFATSSPMPNGYSGNTSVLDSIESLFAHHGVLDNGRPRDVVWRVSDGDVTADMVFDDYLHPDAFILSSMVPSATFADADGVGSGSIRLEDSNRMTFHDGFQETDSAFRTDLVNHGWGATVRFQNAATPLPGVWQVPAHGQGSGVRSEPIARGGAEGRGLWLDGDGYVDYPVADQPQDVHDRTWYVGVHLDARFEEDGVARTVLGFPDGSRLVARGLSRLELEGASGGLLHAVDLPAELALAPRSWRHVALRIHPHGKAIEVLVDGLPLAEWTCNETPAKPRGMTSWLDSVFFTEPEVEPISCDNFAMTEGAFSLGQLGRSEGFRGWADDLVVFAADPGDEVACNHARGTLVRLDDAADPDLRAKSAAYPLSTHQALDDLLSFTDGDYLCFREPDPSQTSLHALPAASHSLRQPLTFAELDDFRFGVPRPDSSSNDFCLSCHTASEPMGLGLAALTPLPIALEDDTRRQPSQPPMRVGGVIPADWLGAGLPAATILTGSEGHPIDAFLFPAGP